MNRHTMRRAATAAILVFLLGPSAGAVAKAVEPAYQQTFDGVSWGAVASAAGFTVNATSEQSVWTVRDGCLHALMHHKPYDGGNVAVSIPKLERARLDFRVWLGSENYRHCGFRVRIYGLSTYCHGYGSSRMAWHRYTSRYTDGRRKNVIVVDGFHYARCKVREAFEGYGPGRVVHFPMLLGLAERAKIISRLDKIVTGRQLAAARLFIMSNAPAPCLEEYTRQELLDQVKQGGLKMLIFGGLYIARVRR